MSEGTGRTPTAGDRAGRRGRVARLAVIVVGLGFLGAAVVATWDTFVEALTVSPVRWVAAFLVCSVGLTVTAWSWAAVHPAGSDTTGLVRGFLLAQPSKYVPGGVAMPVGQVTLSRPHDSSTGAALARFVIHSLMMVVGACWVGGLAAVAGPRRGVGVATVAAAVVGSLVLTTVDLERVVGWLGRMLAKASPRLAPRVTALALGIPPARRVRALAMTVLGLALMAVPFHLVLEERLGLGASMAAFAVAWAAGFVLVPLPAGAGAREAVLAFMLAGSVSLGPVIAASVLYRSAMLAAETLTALAAGAGGRRSRRASNMRSGGN